MMFLLAAMMLLGATATPLDDYVSLDDGVFHVAPNNQSFSTLNYTATFYTVTSQQWMNSSVSDTTIWRHTLLVIIPTVRNASCTDAFLWLTWGSGKAGHPEPWTPSDIENDLDLAVITSVAVRTQCPAAALYQIPNEAIFFNAVNKSKNEDDAIAFTWARFMDGGYPPEFILFFPMTKAAVRAMDAVQVILPHVTGFIVSGASKRGWTTWLTGAVDPKKRVIAIVPCVLDLLNFQAFIHRQFRSYGGFTFALESYWKEGIMKNIDTPGMDAFASLVDPYSYRDRLTMPKLSVNAVGDEFQLLDDQAHWAHDLPGETHLLLIQNADHFLVTNFDLVINAVVAFCQTVVKQVSRPSVSWRVSPATGQISAHASVAPRRVQLLSTTVSGFNNRRDFRDVILNNTPCVKLVGGCLRFLYWSAENVEGIVDFTTNVTAGATGWTGFYLEFTFAGVGGLDDFIVSTPASVLPLGFPFPDCLGEACGDGILL